MRLTSWPLVLVGLWCVTLAAAQKNVATTPVGLASMRLKLVRISSYAKSEHQSTQTTEMTEAEINAYLNSGAVRLPQGVQSVILKGQPGVITGHARVDFDQLKTGRNSSNPLLSMFSGVHDIEVVAHAQGRNGMGYAQVDSVSLDGVEVPTFLLELFVDKYVTPKYPGIGMNSKFALTDRIDSATVGSHSLTVVQR